MRIIATAVEWTTQNDTVVVMFYGETEDGREVRFGVDHRMAQPIIEAVLRDERPECDVPIWAVL